MLARTAFSALLVLSATAGASAHHPMGGTTPQTLWHGLLSGFGHPVIGLDHLAFVVAMGLLATPLARGALMPLLSSPPAPSARPSTSEASTCLMPRRRWRSRSWRSAS
jgi:hypothetical protein